VSETTEPTASAEASERIEWLELFFDLVAVAAVAVLTEGLREDVTWGGTALFALLYAGIWFGWVSVVLYANVAGPATRTRTVLVAMFLVAVMAASAPIHFPGRANAFALGFLGLRLAAARGSLQTGRVLASWPALQFGGAIAPWVIAIWVDAPWKYWLWALGLALDLGAALVREERGDQERLARMQRHLDEHRERGGRRGREPRPALDLAVVDVEPEHLQERLGLFVIIVLGEAVSQLVLIAARSPWTRDFKVDAIAAFLVLAGLWWLTFSYGFFGTPHVRLAELPPSFGLPLHLLTTIGIVAVAAGFGTIVEHPELGLGDGMRWITCGGFALYFLVMGVAGLTGPASARWLYGWALPCTLVPIAVALAGDRISSRATLAAFLACIAWMSVYGRSAHRGGDARASRKMGRSAPAK
jgi:low temperature requirement protein LtrA